MKRILHTVTPTGSINKIHRQELPKENTFKIENKSLWMHSIDRVDNNNSIQGFLILGVFIVIISLFVIYFPELNRLLHK